ncbi:HTH-type transcriptional regulator ChbR [Pseudooctadecabacter jejudonensis]|uniref:HTH-type transcriptional regulator ChbR n=2 Tax=Pseudooctadecabacter jejudonensis TaxID=1391910 RepID=A0A1Y5T6E7_9RHOB|nr:HTH-type transcriptional regulator ChbR [Pseudooctadecabacter jejudonensis]
METVQTLTAAQIFASDEAFLLIRADLDTRRPRGLHTQDFHEMLWVQNGTVRLHMSGLKRDLTEGDLVFIAPDQPHAIQGKGDAAIVVSLAIRPGVIRAIGNRHEDLTGLAFWAGGATPAVTHRDIRQLADLNTAALKLERSPRDKLYLEAFLLPLLTALDRAPDGLHQGAPDWLIHALSAARDPAVFRQGAAGFVALCGRAHPHVSRTMRRYTGQTPVEYINAQRMAHAARCLTGTADSISDIADSCGLPNLSHFHKTFLAAFGETPQKYRTARQRDLVQPRG